MTLAGASERAKPFVYDPENLNEMARAILAATGFRQAPGVDHVYHRGRLAAWNFQLAVMQLLQGEDQKWGVGGQVIFDGPLVTLQHKPGQAAVLGGITHIGGKRLRTHWILERYALKAWVSELPAKEFLGLVAKAVGGKVLETKEAFELGIDSTEIRRRALATFEAVRKDPEYKSLNESDRVYAELAQAAVADATPSQIAEALASSGARTRIPLGSSLRVAAARYLTYLMNQPAEVGDDVSVRGRQPQERSALDALRRIDPRLIGYVDLNAMFQPRLFLQSVDGLGRPGPMIAVP